MANRDYPCLVLAWLGGAMTNRGCPCLVLAWRCHGKQRLPLSCLGLAVLPPATAANYFTRLAPDWHRIKSSHIHILLSSAKILYSLFVSTFSIFFG